MGVRLFIVHLGFLTALWSLGNCLAADAPQSSWRAGDYWDLIVEAYSSNTPSLQGEIPSHPPDPLRFQMRVLVLGKERLGPSACWRLDFIRDKDAPASIARGYRVLVDQQSGWVKKVTPVKGSTNVVVEEVKDGSLLTGIPEGFPLELFSATGPEAVTYEGVLATLKLTRTAQGEAIVVEAVRIAQGGREVRIRQTWAKGEKWWRQYERYVDGRKDLYAQRHPPPQGALVSVTKPDLHSHLRQDPRLRAPVTIMLENPKLEEVLQQLRNATGVSLTVGTGLESHAPQLGSIQLRDAPAWMVMRLLAQRQLKDGRWEKEREGYRLMGTVDATPAELSSGLSRTRLRPILAGAFLVLLVLLVLLLVVRHQRSRGKNSAVT